MHERVSVAGCFEWVETTVDESGGSRQVLLEDLRQVVVSRSVDGAVGC